MQKPFLCLMLCMLVVHADTIILDSSVRAKGFSLLLGDIAQVIGDKDLGKIYIDTTPPIGETYFYSRSFVIAALKRQGIDCGKISWQGAKSVEVETQSSSLYPKDTASLAEEYLRLSLPWKYSDVHCRLLKVSSELLRFPTPRKSLNFKPSFIGFPKNRGKVAISVAILVDGQQAVSARLLFRIEVFQNAYFTRNSLKRHTRLQLSSLRRKRVEITDMKVLPVSSMAELSGKRCRHNLSAEHMIVLRDIEDAPLVRKGAAVYIVINYANLHISAPGKALQNGKKGEIIKVRNLSSRKIIDARIIDKGHVAFESGN